MTDRSATIERHYGSDSIVERLLEAVTRDGHDPTSLRPDALFPYDQFHGRGLAATVENTARLRLDASHHVLDVGSGIGGPARYMASKFGCRVTGIDVTAQFVEAATDLTARCGLDDRIGYRHGNALSMPFSDGTFDAATCFNVAMNIEDKASLAREIRRVVRPHGRIAWSEATLGPAGEPHYPLPWARSRDISFLVTADDLRRQLESSSLEVVDWIDESDATDAAFARAAAAPEQTASSMAANRIVLGDDFLVRLQNVGRSFKERRLVPIFVVATR